MKSIFFLILVPLFFNAQIHTDVERETKWLTDFDKALKLATKEEKNVMVYFTGSDWCPPCKKLKTDLFDSEAFNELSDDYILLYVDMPRNKDLLTPGQIQHNNTLFKKYNKQGVFPLIKIVNAKGNELDEYSGYSMNGEISYHLNLLNKYK